MATSISAVKQNHGNDAGLDSRSSQKAQQNHKVADAETSPFCIVNIDKHLDDLRVDRIQLFTQNNTSDKKKQQHSSVLDTIERLDLDKENNSVEVMGEGIWPQKLDTNVSFSKQFCSIESNKNN